MPEIKDTVVSGVKSPTLTQLKSEPCSIEELQAALVQLIEIVNRNATYRQVRIFDL